MTPVDGTGAERPGKERGLSRSSEAREETLEMGVISLDGPEPAELRIQFLSEFFWKRVEFEFRDVDLP